jgi:dihydrofolate reductase
VLGYSDVQDIIEGVVDFPYPVYVIGGEEIYKLFLPCCDELYLTITKKQYEGDAFFPELDKDTWRVEKILEDNDMYTRVHYINQVWEEKNAV